MDKLGKQLLTYALGKGGRRTYDTIDQDAYRALITELKGRKLSKAQLFRLADTFLGKSPTDQRYAYKSMAEAWEKISKTHYLYTMSAVRAKTIDSINV